MNKLVCETKKARVLSVKLVCDAKADLTSARYSIQEMDQSFLDAESKSSPKEILLDFEIDKDKIDLKSFNYNGFEEVLTKNLPEPTTPEYEQEKAGVQPGEDLKEGLIDIIDI